MGVVYNPVLGELFAAAAGGGACLNGAPLATSAATELAGALMGTEVAREGRAGGGREQGDAGGWGRSASGGAHEGMESRGLGTAGRSGRAGAQHKADLCDYECQALAPSPRSCCIRCSLVRADVFAHMYIHARAQVGTARDEETVDSTFGRVRALTSK